MRYTLTCAINAAIFAIAGTGTTSAADLNDKEMENLVLRSYPYVAMFNVNNKFALDANNPMNSGGYNRVKANTELADHTVQAIAQPHDVPEENWLPIERRDIDLNVIMRIYSPDLEKFGTWQAPKASRL